MVSSYVTIDMLSSKVRLSRANSDRQIQAQFTKIWQGIIQHMKNYESFSEQVEKLSEGPLLYSEQIPI